MKLEHVFRLQEMGFYLHPLNPRSKKAALTDWPNKATNDRERLKHWFTNGYAKSNAGILTTKFKESEALLVVDVDNKEGKMGHVQLQKLEAEGRNFPATLTQTTPNNGYHLIYKTKNPVKSSTSKLASGIDIKSDRGYIVSPWSVLSEGEYVLGDGEISEAPEWLVSFCGRPSAKSDDGTKPRAHSLDSQNALIRARHYLEVEAPKSVQGSRNNTTFIVAAKVKDFGVSRNGCEILMTDLWSPRCDSVIDSEEFSQTLNSVYRNSQRYWI